jgi:hypothetical protein
MPTPQIRPTAAASLNDVHVTSLRSEVFGLDCASLPPLPGGISVAELLRKGETSVDSHVIDGNHRAFYHPHGATVRRGYLLAYAPP